MEKNDYYKTFVAARQLQPARQRLVVAGLWGWLNGSELEPLWSDYYREYCAHCNVAYVPGSYWELMARVSSAIETLMLHDRDLPACYASAEDFRHDILRIMVVADCWAFEQAKQMGLL